MLDDYSELLTYMDVQGYSHVLGYDFYLDIFPDCENAGEMHTDYSHPNAVYLYYDPAKGKLRRRLMLKDTWEDDYMEYVEENQMTLCSGLTYRGRANKLQNAQRMHALAFDIDQVGVDEFRIIEKRWELEPGAYRSIPRPTYTVLSGSGVHLYYVFDEPIDLYPNIKTQLKSLKYDLTFSIWEYGETSKEESIQYQSINQAFRMPGSYNCKEKVKRRVEAFRTGDRVSLEYLNQYVVEPGNAVDINKPFKPTKMTRPQAKERYPEWYERVVAPQVRQREVEEELEELREIDFELFPDPELKAQKEALEQELEELRIITRSKRRKKWAIDEKVHGDDPYALYHWWIRQLRKIKGGHRYYFLMCMAIYADKCNVPRKKLVEDMKNIFDEIAAIPHKNELTKADMRSALEAYSREYYDTCIEEINYWTGVGIVRNKRNGRSQKRHLEVARGDKADMKDRGEPFKNPEGRPPKKSKQRDQIIQYRQEHPDAKPSDCMRDTGISRNTVYRWWNELDGE